jgi:glycosyltransferase involved in cell wall biosynthesis
MGTARPSRILYLAGGSTGTKVYGAERSLLDLVAGMDRTRFLPCCAITQGDGPYADAIRDLGAPVVNLGLRAGGAFDLGALLATARGARDLIRVAREVGADLLHVNALKVNHHAAVAGRVLGLPVVLHLQGHVKRRAYFSRLAFAASRIVACSEAVAAPWRGMPGADRRLRVIYYGLDPAPFAFSEGRRREHRARLGLADDTFAVGVVSRLSPSKKLETLFEALRFAASADPKVKALIAGDAPPYWREYGERIKLLPKQMGIADRVAFLGYAEDIASLYSAFDAVVAPSDAEGLCRVVLEAMAAGRAVIAVRAGGPVELVDDERTGLLVPPEQPAALASAILRLARDPDLRTRLGEAAAARVASRFSLASYLRSFDDMYSELLHQPRWAVRRLRDAPSGAIGRER